jgi:hypothetical protein
MYFTGFVCVKCGAAYPPDQDLLLCPACQNLLEGKSSRFPVLAMTPHVGHRCASTRRCNDERGDPPAPV